MKKIGFLDDSLDNFHADTFLRLSRESWEKKGWKVDCAMGINQEESRAWAKANNVRYADGIGEFQNCDAIMVLAPGNPGAHLSLVESAVQFGVPVYVDKPFAPDFESAKKIFSVADSHNVPLITTSALRCAPALTEFIANEGRDKITHIRTWCGSGEFEEYAIHAVEMMVSTMGAQIEQCMHLNTAGQRQIHARFSGGRTGSVFFHPNSATHYQAMISIPGETRHVPCGGPGMFEALGDLVLEFFVTRKEVVDRHESLAIRKLLDFALSSCEQGRYFDFESFKP